MSIFHHHHHMLLAAALIIIIVGTATAASLPPHHTANQPMVDMLGSNFISVPNAKPVPSRQSIKMAGNNAWSACQLVGLAEGSVYYSDYTHDDNVTVFHAHGKVSWDVPLPYQGASYQGVMSLSQPHGLLAASTFDRPLLMTLDEGKLIPVPSGVCNTSGWPGSFSASGDVYYCFEDGGQFTQMSAYPVTPAGYGDKMWTVPLNSSFFVGGDSSGITVDDANGMVWLAYNLAQPSVVGVDAKTGAIRSSLFGGTSYGNNMMQQIHLSPDGELVYGLVNQWFLSCMEWRTGKELWRYSYGDADQLSASGDYAVTPEGLVLLTLTRYSPDPRQTYMKAFDGRTGKVAWEWAIDGPTVLPFGNFLLDYTRQKALWVTWDTSIHAVDYVTGKGKTLNVTIGQYSNCAFMDPAGNLYSHRQGPGANNSIEIIPLGDMLDAM